MGQEFLLFCSYASLDVARAKEKAALLRAFKEIALELNQQRGKLDYQEWYDCDGIHQGDNWREVIPAVLAKAEALLLFLSPGWFNSDICREEFRFFVEAHPQDWKSRVFPFELRRLTESDLNEDIRQFYQKELKDLQRVSWGEFFRWSEEDRDRACQDGARGMHFKLHPLVGSVLRVTPPKGDIFPRLGASAKAEREPSDALQKQQQEEELRRLKKEEKERKKAALRQSHSMIARKQWVLAMGSLLAHLDKMGQWQEAWGLARPLAAQARILAQKGDEDPDGWRVAADVLQSVGAVAHQLGKHQDAWEVFQEVLVLRQRGAQEEDPVACAAVAVAQTNCATALAEVGRRAEALSFAEQAEAALRVLANDHPADHRPEWALSLGNLAGHLSFVGRFSDAVPHAERAVSLYEELSAASPAYRPDLAAFLGNLAGYLSDVGRFSDAVPHAERAVSLYEELSAAFPARYRPDLAQSLGNFANRLSDVGRFSDALPHAERAVSLYEELSAAFPARYRPDLARSLGSFASHLRDVGRFSDAVPHAERAVSLCEELSAASPARYRPDLAQSLGNFASHLRDVGRFLDALPYAERAVSLYEELSAALPARYRPNLATFLGNFADCLSAVGCFSDALPHAERAVSLYEELSAAFPARYRPDLARSLGNLANHLSDVGRFSDAVPYAERAVSLYEELSAAFPARYRPDWAGSLGNFANCLSAVGRFSDAVPHAERAVSLCKELSAAFPARYRPDWAGSLHNLANYYNDLGEYDRAYRVAFASYSLYGDLQKTLPERYRPNCALAAGMMVTHLSSLQRFSEAESYADYSLQTYEDLSRVLPQAYQDKLLWARLTRARLRWGAGRKEEALQIGEQVAQEAKAFAQRLPLLGGLLLLETHCLCAQIQEECGDVTALRRSLEACEALGTELTKLPVHRVQPQRAAVQALRAVLAPAGSVEAQEAVQKALPMLLPHFRRTPHVYAEQMLALWRAAQHSGLSLEAADEQAMRRHLPMFFAPAPSAETALTA